MGPEYFTVGAYIPADEGTILCVKCGEKRGLPASDQITENQMFENFGDDGAWCDVCGVEIVEPYTEETDETEEMCDALRQHFEEDR